MNFDVKKLVSNAFYTALYVVLCYVFQPISFGAIQVRIAEALCVLPIFDKTAVISITLGCFLSNFLFSSIYDAIFGTLATFIGLLFIVFIKKDNFYIGFKDKKIKIDAFFVRMLPTIISNAVIVPFVIKYAFGDTMPLLLIAATVGIGEIISIYGLGYILYNALIRTKLYKNV